MIWNGRHSFTKTSILLHYILGAANGEKNSGFLFFWCSSKFKFLHLLWWQNTLISSLQALALGSLISFPSWQVRCILSKGIHAAAKLSLEVTPFCSSAGKPRAAGEKTTQTHSSEVFASPLTPHAVCLLHLDLLPEVAPLPAGPALSFPLALDGSFIRVTNQITNWYEAETSNGRGFGQSSSSLTIGLCSLQTFFHCHRDHFNHAQRFV